MGHASPAISVETEDDRSDLLLPTALAEQSLRAQDVDDVTTALRRALHIAAQPPASIIHAATEFARILTGAHGVALGLRMNGALVCRARSGDLSPELGSALSADSGISGECLQSGSLAVCVDTLTDDRIDRAACSALGVRSIVAIPVRGRAGVVGMLEAFSAQPSAFAEELMEALRALTEVIELAHACETRAREAETSLALACRALSIRRGIPSAVLEDDRLSDQILGGPSRSRFWIAAIASVVLMLASVGVWLGLREPIPENAGSESAAEVVPQKPDAKPEIRHTTFLKPDAGITARRPALRKTASSRKSGKASSRQASPEKTTASAPPDTSFAAPDGTTGKGATSARADDVATQ